MVVFRDAPKDGSVNSFCRKLFGNSASVCQSVYHPNLYREPKFHKNHNEKEIEREIEWKKTCSSLSFTDTN